MPSVKKYSLSYRSVLTSLRNIIASNKFFYAILVITLLQALWFVFSFQPAIYDEPKHLTRIMIHAEQVDPFLGEQRTEWDHTGAVTRDGSFMYYYLMSWPYRLVDFFTDNTAAQIIVLRMLNTALFMVGLVVMRRALRAVKGFTPSVVNLSLLFFVLTPAAGLMAGTINYDNLVLPIFAALLLYSVRFHSSLESDKKVRTDLLLLIAALSMFISVVKWTAIALAIPIVLYICWALIRKYKTKTIKELIIGLWPLSRARLVFLGAGIILAAVPFIERPVMNTLTYGNPSPDCNLVMSNDRCRQYWDHRVYDDILINKDPQFRPVDIVQYTIVHWIPKMTTTMTNMLERGWSSQLPIAVAVYNLAFVLGGILILLTIRNILALNTRNMLFIVAVGYTAILVFTEYKIYVDYGQPGAIRARYLVPILPIMFVFVAYATKVALGRFKDALTITPMVIVLLLTQGGSVVTWLLTTPDDLYWNKQMVEMNRGFKEVARPLVKE